MVLNVKVPTRRHRSLVPACVFSALVTCLSTASAATGAFDPSADPVFAKLVRFNAGLTSYTAHVDVETHVLFGRFSLHGTLYNWGDDSKVIFDNVPSIARAAVDHQPSIEAPSLWPAHYTISLLSQTAEETTYRLVPLEPGDVREVDAVVHDASGLVGEYVWTTASGMTITSDQTYEAIDGFELVASSTTRTRGGYLHAISTTTFSNYALNDPIPDSVVASMRS